MKQLLFVCVLLDKIFTFCVSTKNAKISMQTSLSEQELPLNDYSASLVAAAAGVGAAVHLPFPLRGTITQRLHCNLLLSEFEWPSPMTLWPSMKLPFNRTSGSE